jgi:hypothetical protein
MGIAGLSSARDDILEALRLLIRFASAVLVIPK